MVICRKDLTYLKCDQCCLQESDFKMVISQLTEKFITFFKTSLERTGHLRWNFLIGPFILQRYL